MLAKKVEAHDVYRKRLRVKQALLIALVVFSFFASRAMGSPAELCPAELRIQAVGGHFRYSFGPSRAFGFELTSQKARTIGGVLVLDTDHGWFVAPFPPLHTEPVLRHFAAADLSFEEHEFVSQKLYVDIGAPATVNHAFLTSVHTDDPAWPSDMTCLPHTSMASSRPTGESGRPSPYVATLLDGADLFAKPAANDLVLIAKVSPPLESTACATPFRDAAALGTITPDTPDSGEAFPRTTFVEIQLDPKGTLIDAWVYYTSGWTAFDVAAVDAAKLSRYSGAIAYCTPVPSEYLYAVTYVP